MLVESCRLAELKDAIFSRTGHKTKKWRRLKLFLPMVFKHGLLEGSTILLQYSSISHIELESSLSGEFKYAISAGYDVILKNKSIQKCKKWHFAMNVHGHCSMCYQRDWYFFSTHVTPNGFFRIWKIERKAGLTRRCRKVKVTNMLRNDSRREKEKKRKERGSKLRQAASAAL